MQIFSPCLTKWCHYQLAVNVIAGEQRRLYLEVVSNWICKSHHITLRGGRNLQNGRTVVKLLPTPPAASPTLMHVHTNGIANPVSCFTLLLAASAWEKVENYKPHMIFCWRDTVETHLTRWVIILMSPWHNLSGFKYPCQIVSQWEEGCCWWGILIYRIVDPVKDIKLYDTHNVKHIFSHSLRHTWQNCRASTFIRRK